jgi:hypothetical protein
MGVQKMPNSSMKIKMEAGDPLAQHKGNDTEWI